MRLQDLVAGSQRIAATRSKLAKVELLAGLVAAMSPDEAAIGVSFLCGEVRQGRIGVGWGALRSAAPPAAAAEPQLTLADVDRAFDELAAVGGAGVQAARRGILHGLLQRATAEEQDFLQRLLLGELRQGALEAFLLDAVAKAASLPAGDVRRAAMLGGSVPAVAAAALRGGAAALAEFRLQVLTPVLPMLAQSAPSATDALEQLGTAAFEWKLDGARVQVHRAGDEVRVFTRSLNDVTDSVPELVAAVRALPARQLILDGEVIALHADGRPCPFQVTMSRFGRRDVADAPGELPLQPFFFDLLHVDGQDLLDRPGTERWLALGEAVPLSMLVPREIVADAAAAETFLQQVLARGHEGVMAKALDAPYEAGRRGGNWLKVKVAHTLDLVVLAVEWGSGRRQGWLSNLHLGARDPDTGGFVMLGKTFKGMTDELLQWQTQALQAIAVRTEGHVVHVRPELVVEVAFDGVQRSSQYPGGVALRFARVKRYRSDKTAADADTIAQVRAFLA